MTRRANHTITQSVPTPPHPPVVSPSHLRDRLVDKHVANPVHHPLQRQEVPDDPGARKLDGVGDSAAKQGYALGDRGRSFVVRPLSGRR